MRSRSSTTIFTEMGVGMRMMIRLRTSYSLHTLHTSVLEPHLNTPHPIPLHTTPQHTPHTHKPPHNTHLHTTHISTHLNTHILYHTHLNTHTPPHNNTHNNTDTYTLPYTRPSPASIGKLFLLAEEELVRRDLCSNLPMALPTDPVVALSLAPTVSGLSSKQSALRLSMVSSILRT